VKTAEDEFDSQFKSYENQHAEYVKHTEKVMKEENERIREKEREYEKWEEKLEKLKERENDEIKKNQEGLEKYKKQLSQRQQCNSQGQNTNFGPLGKPWDGDSSGLIPNRKYYDLPAGLMAACVPINHKPYEPIDPSKLRLVPHIQPSQKLQAALEEFYRPTPPNVAMRNGWPNGSLDEFFKLKGEAILSFDSPTEKRENPFKNESKPPPARKSRFSGIKA